MRKLIQILMIVLLVSYLAECSENLPDSANLQCDQETEECIPAAQCMLSVINNTMVVEGNSCGKEGHVCCKKDKNLKTIETPCGYRNMFGLGLYGVNQVKSENEEKFAELAEFPWIISIEDDNGKFCSGSLINEKVIITSANCIIMKDTSKIQVRVGAWKNSGLVGLETEQLHEISRVIYHDENVNRYQPNIAYLVLSTPVNISMFVGTVCLSPSLENLAMDDCMAVGWKSGQSASEDISIEENLILQSCDELMNRTTMMIPTHSKCARIEKKLEMGSSVICRINSTESNYQQVGIVFHNPQSLQTSHVILIDVSEFTVEIAQKLQDLLGIDDESYTFSQMKSRGFFDSMRYFFRETARLIKDPEFRENAAIIGTGVVAVTGFVATIFKFFG